MERKRKLIKWEEETACEPPSYESMQPQKQTIKISVEVEKRKNGNGIWEKTRSNFKKIGKYRRMRLLFQPIYPIQNLNDYKLEVLIEKVSGEGESSLLCYTSENSCRKSNKKEAASLCQNQRINIYLSSSSPSSSDGNISIPWPISSNLTIDLFFKPHLMKSNRGKPKPVFKIDIYITNFTSNRSELLFSTTAEIQNPKWESDMGNVADSHSAAEFNFSVPIFF